jgi:hypothetical protein
MPEVNHQHAWRWACAAVLGLVLLIGLNLSTPSPVSAQLLARNFPPTALRGVLVIQNTPEITLNGQPARLSPAARLRSTDNLLMTPASVTGEKLHVHYTLDEAGHIRDAWVLRPDELANRPWPTTAEQAQKWVFDPLKQTWTKP